MASSEHEWARRIRAAASYAGIEQKELARQLGMSVTTLGRHLKAEKRPHEIRALTQTVAEITQLPYAFFTVDYRRLGELEGPTTVPIAHIHQGAADRGADIVLMDGDRVIGQVEVKQVQEIAGVAAENAVAKLLDDLSASDAQDLESALVAFTRRAKAVAVGPPVDDVQESAAAQRARDEADASEGSTRAADEATPGTEGQTAP